MTDTDGRLDSIGFVGLGKMNLPMARNLLEAGREVIGVDVDEEPMAAFEATPGLCTDELLPVASGPVRVRDSVGLFLLCSGFYLFLTRRRRAVRPPTVSRGNFSTRIGAPSPQQVIPHGLAGA